MFIFPPMCQIYPQQLMSAIDFQFPNSVDVCYMFNALLPQRNVLHYRTVERSKISGPVQKFGNLQNLDCLETEPFLSRMPVNNKKTEKKTTNSTFFLVCLFIYFFFFFKIFFYLSISTTNPWDGGVYLVYGKSRLRFYENRYGASLFSGCLKKPSFEAWMTFKKAERPKFLGMD